VPNLFVVTVTRVFCTNSNPEGQPALDQDMNNVAAKSNDAAWRIIRKRSSGSVTSSIGMAMLVMNLTQPVTEAKVYI